MEVSKQKCRSTGKHSEMEELSTLPSWQITLSLYAQTSQVTMAEAIRQLSAKGYSVRVDRVLLGNEAILEAMRHYGVSAVVGRIKEMPETGQAVSSQLDDFLLAHPDGSIGNPQISFYGPDSDFEILGHTFHGVRDLEDHVELSLHDGGGLLAPCASVVQPRKTCDVHVGVVWKRYPCFDFYDSVNENRYFNNFIVRRRAIVEDDLVRVLRSDRGYNEDRITPYVSDDLVPMVYYDDVHSVKVAR